jgi:hypothetical protein
VGTGLAVPSRDGARSYGVLLELALALFPDASDRRKITWQTPHDLFDWT